MAKRIKMNGKEYKPAYSSTFKNVSLKDIMYTWSIFEEACGTKESIMSSHGAKLTIWVPKSCKLPKTKRIEWASKRSLEYIKKRYPR